MKTPLSILILVSFLLTAIIGPVPAFAQDEFRLPVPGVMINLSPPENSPVLKGVTVFPDDPFKFDFILDKGKSVQQSQLKQESEKLIKYFLAAITTPENDLWVNLSPYEKNRIIPPNFGQTDMGRDLLAEDYILKQITASLIYPESEIGRKFWKRVYEEAQKKYGTTDIPVNTFNKVWIVPEQSKVYEHANTAYVVKARLKVMLEQDYLSLQKHDNVGAQLTGPLQRNDINALGSQVVREVVIPELEKEVNEGKNFATLRQVYYSLILAVWFKKRMKDSIIGRKYMDQNKVTGIHYDPLSSLRGSKLSDTEVIYQRYLRAFKKGVYNYIKEEPDPRTGGMTPRKYFSGGAAFNRAMKTTIFEEALKPGEAKEDFSRQDDFAMVDVNLAAPSMKDTISTQAMKTPEAYDVHSIGQAIREKEAQLLAIGIGNIKPFALRTVSQQYYRKDPMNPFGANPDYVNKLFMVSVNPAKFLEYKKQNGLYLLRKVTTQERIELEHEFLERLFNTFTSRLNMGDNGVTGENALARSPVFEVFRGFYLPSENQDGESDLAKVDFSNPETALSSIYTKKYWYSQASVPVNSVKDENEVFSTKLTEEDLGRIKGQIEEYLDHDVMPYLRAHKLLASPEQREYYRNIILRRQIPYFLYSRFLTWLLEDSQQAKAMISKDRLLDANVWTDPEKRTFAQELIKTCQALAKTISREAQKKYRNYSGPQTDALIFYSVSLPSRLNEMAGKLFGFQEDELVIFSGLGKNKSVDVLGNQVTLFNIPVASIDYLEQKDDLKTDVLLKESDVEPIRIKMIEMFKKNDYFRELIRNYSQAMIVDNLILKAERQMQRLKKLPVYNQTIRDEMRFKKADAVWQASAWAEGLERMPSNGTVASIPTSLIFASKNLEVTNRSLKPFNSAEQAKWLNKILNLPEEDQFKSTDIIPSKEIVGKEGSLGQAYRPLHKFIFDEKLLDNNRLLRWAMIHEAFHVIYPGLPVDYLNETVTELMTEKTLGQRAAVFDGYSARLKVLKEFLAMDKTGKVQEALLESYRTGNISLLRQAVIETTGTDKLFIILVNMELFEFSGDKVRGNLNSPALFDYLRLYMSVVKKHNETVLAGNKNNFTLFNVARNMEDYIAKLVKLRIFRRKNSHTVFLEDIPPLPTSSGRIVNLRKLGVNIPFAETNIYTQAMKTSIIADLIVAQFVNSAVTNLSSKEFQSALLDPKGEMSPDLIFEIQKRAELRFGNRKGHRIELGFMVNPQGKTLIKLSANDMSFNDAPPGPWLILAHTHGSGLPAFLSPQDVRAVSFHQSKGHRDVKYHYLILPGIGVIDFSDVPRGLANMIPDLNLPRMQEQIKTEHDLQSWFDQHQEKFALGEISIHFIPWSKLEPGKDIFETLLKIKTAAFARSSRSTNTQAMKTVMQARKIEASRVANTGTGGIDLTAKRMHLEDDSDKAAVSQPMNLDRFENIEINGLYIKDIEIKPLKDLPKVLGVSVN